MKALKKFLARRGIPEKIFSDNAKTFTLAATKIKQIFKSDKLHHYLNIKEIKRQFNLSRAPRWGGQFKRMVGIVKSMLYKCVGKSNLTWSELEEVLLDIKMNINNRPLTYVEDDIQLPILTPSIMVQGQLTLAIEENEDNIDETNIRKRYKYIKQCKERAWNC